MYYVKQLLIAMIVLFGGNQIVQAHAIWIESNPVGIKNQSHTIRVYYGEYATGEIEKTKDWYSDLNQLKLNLVDSENKVELKLTDKGDYLEASFVPAKDGIYQIFVSHPAKELGGTTRYEFLAQSQIQVGKDAGYAAIPLAAHFIFQNKIFKTNDVVEIQLLRGNSPVANKEVLVMSPNGWSKNYKTDSQGKIKAEAIWAGTYVIENSHMADQSGTWNDKTYNKNWQGLTASFQVK